MTQKTRASLDSLWVHGYTPTQTDYENLFDSFLNFLSDAGFLVNDTYIWSNFVGAILNPFASNPLIKKFIFLNCPGITDFSFNNNAVITSVNLSNSTLNVTSIFITNCPLLTIIDVANCGTLQTVGFNGCTLLESIGTTDLSSITNGNFNGCALTVMNIDIILSMCNSGGLAGGTLNLSGGTNGIPTGGVLNADYVALLGKGWTVNINT
jgi:hypothetical protein